MNCPVCGGSLESEGQECPKCSAASKIKTVPAEIHKFNFGAFALTLPWALAHRLWLVTFLSLALLPVAYYGLFFYLILVYVFKLYIGHNANKIVWKSGFYVSVEKVKSSQKKWERAGGYSVLVWIFVVIPAMALIFVFGIIRNFDQQNILACLDSMSAIKIAEDMYFEDNKKWTDNANYLTIYMSEDCKDPLGNAAGCVDETGKNIVRARLDNNCRTDWEINTTKKGFLVKAVAKDKNSCHICVGMSGYRPTSIRECRKYSESFHPDCKMGL